MAYVKRIKPLDWTEAIAKVLAEKGGPMSVKDITNEIIRKGYYSTASSATPDNSVNSYLSENKEGLFERVSRGVYKLKGTPTPHTTVGGASLVVTSSSTSARPCATAEVGNAVGEVVYKIRVNRPCRLFIDEEEKMTLKENELTKITLPEGEYLRKVVAEDDSTIFDEKVIALFHPKVDIIALDAISLEEAKRNALPDEIYQSNLYFKPTKDRLSVNVVGKKDYVDTIDIPNQIKYAGYVYPVTGVLIQASGLKSITIPNSVRGIQINDCSFLTSVIIQNGVTYIGYYAFSGCESLRSITIPDSVTKIDSKAFEGCSSLTAIDYAGTKKQWEEIEKGHRISHEYYGDIVKYDWDEESNIKVIRCKDGEIKL